jgi:hypothetical protein
MKKMVVGGKSNAYMVHTTPHTGGASRPFKSYREWRYLMAG